ncbi:MAG: short chain dehydrogenase [Deltaproteobacteria bacterium RBG_16_71_12]|nr:MAG: short chain dehydrogenase [Deltaproteobacteria bacterium RBG_16_71_12]
MSTLNGKTALITGASRGIGRAMAIRFAKDGANVVLASKSTVPHPKLAGTLHTVAEEVKAAGGTPLVVGCDVRSEEDVQRAVDETKRAFGGLDVLVNNAGAISLTSLEDTPVKRFDLMLSINARAVFLTAKLCLPLLVESARAGRSPHILSLSPPVAAKDGRFDPKWLKGHTAYSLTKYGMTLLTQGFAEELRDVGIAVNALWPQTLIATAAVDMLMGDEGMKASRTPEIMADAAYQIVTTPGLAVTGQALIDEALLRARGVTDFAKYLSAPGVEPMTDLYVEAPGAA